MSLLLLFGGGETVLPPTTGSITTWGTITSTHIGLGTVTPSHAHLGTVTPSHAGVGTMTSTHA